MSDYHEKPKHLTLSQESDRLVIVWPKRVWHSTIPFVLFSLVVFLPFVIGVISDPEVRRLWFAHPLLYISAPLIYFSAVLLVNKTVIEIDAASITVKKGPIRWFDGQTRNIPRDDIKQIFGDVRISTGGSRPGKGRAQYYIYAQPFTRDQRQLIVKAPSKEYMRFLETTLARACQV